VLKRLQSDLKREKRPFDEKEIKKIKSYQHKGFPSGPPP